MNLIDNHVGLHDRVTHEIALKPFTLSETEEYFQSFGFPWSRLSVLHTYMAVGGVPYYLSLFNPDESPAQGIAACSSLKMENYKKNTEGCLLLCSEIQNLILLSSNCWRQSLRG